MMSNKLRLLDIIYLAAALSAATAKHHSELEGCLFSIAETQALAVHVPPSVSSDPQSLPD